MSSRLTREQIEDLLIYCGTEPPRYWKDDECLICCPVHGESNPSMGVSAEKQICHCFSCGFSGDFAKLLAHSRIDEFTVTGKKFIDYKKARNFLKSRYELEYRELGSSTRSIKRYEQTFSKAREHKREELPKFKLAPFKSGKETYKYFYDRGFNTDDVKEYMIGRDLDNKTVTIPVFYEDNKLAGIIGRYIDKNRLKNQRYKIYDNFERSSVLYPLNKAKPIDNTVILVEGQFDAIRMHKLGYTNTYAIMTNSLSKEQADWLCNNCSKVIWVGDNDSRGIEGRDKARALLKNKIAFSIVEYPSYGKDVCDWEDEDIKTMISNAKGYSVRKIKRLI